MGRYSRFQTVPRDLAACGSGSGQSAVGFAFDWAARGYGAIFPDIIFCEYMFLTKNTLSRGYNNTKPYAMQYFFEIFLKIFFEIFCICFLNLLHFIPNVIMLSRADKLTNKPSLQPILSKERISQFITPPPEIQYTTFNLKWHMPFITRG